MSKLNKSAEKVMIEEINGGATTADWQESLRLSGITITPSLEEQSDADGGHDHENDIIYAPAVSVRKQR